MSDNYIEFIVGLFILLCLVVALLTEPLNVIFTHLKTDCISAFSDSMVAVISAINLAFILYIYHSDKQKKEQEEKIRTTFFWFREIILGKNISIIEKFFTNSLQSVESLKSKGIQGSGQANIIANDINLAIENFQNNRSEATNYFCNLIIIINDKIGSELDLILAKYEDAFMEFIDEVYSCPQNSNWLLDEFKMKAVDIRKEFFSLLYTFEMNQYKK